MGKPPRWLLGLGPLMAGLSAGISGARLDNPSVWVLIGIGLIFGFIPGLIYLIWKTASKDRD